MATGDSVPQLKLSEALGLGLLHGPAELVPVSSSGHLTVVPALLGWDYNEVDGDLRKAFEVALHAGTYAALLLAGGADIRAAARSARPVTAAIIAIAFLPPGAVGYLLEGPIERRLGTPAAVAVGMIVGGATLAWADARAARDAAAATTGQRPAARAGRKFTDATVKDGLWLGLGQAAALIPGVSRNGATLTAARLAGFNRADANRLSWHVAAPVIGAATGLKLARLARRGLPAGALVPFGVGAAASFASTFAAARLIAAVGAGPSLVPYGLYRVALGGAVLRRVRRRRSSQFAR